MSPAQVKYGPAFQKYFEEAMKNAGFYVEMLKLEVTEDICRLMEEKNVTRYQLAKMMDCSPANITKLLRGSTNLTIETLAKIAFLLDSKWAVRAVPSNYEVDVFWMTSPKYSAQDFGPKVKFEANIIEFHPNIAA